MIPRRHLGSLRLQPDHREHTMVSARNSARFVLVVLAITVAACGGKKPPVARPAPPPNIAPPTTAGRPPGPPEPVSEPTVVPAEPVRDDRIASGSLDDLNRNSPLKPLFFEYDSS